MDGGIHAGEGLQWPLQMHGSAASTRADPGVPVWTSARLLGISSRPASRRGGAARLPAERRPARRRSPVRLRPQRPDEERLVSPRLWARAVSPPPLPLAVRKSAARPRGPAHPRAARATARPLLSSPYPNPRVLRPDLGGTAEKAPAATCCTPGGRRRRPETPVHVEMRGRPTRGWAGHGANGKPYQLTHAENVSVGGGRTGELHATYDAAGGMTALTVRRDGACLPVGATCAQHFAYAWDELGRLAHARRWDVNAAEADAFIAEAPSLEETAALGTPAADLHYVYDSSDQRRLKRATDAEGETRHTAYVFASLELRQTSWGEASEQNGAPADYTRDEQTEVVYLFAHGVRLARLALDPALPRTSGGSATEPHVFLELGDHLGSTAAVLDLATSELAERTTYLAYGATDSDYRPERWGAFREDYRFTGKEEDREVGLVYFGKRFLSPALGRWMSADPLAVHVPGRADANLYAYVSGAVLQAVDPVGLEDSWWDTAVSAVKSAGAVVVEKGKEAVEAGKALAQHAIETTEAVVGEIAENPGDFVRGLAEGAVLSTVPQGAAVLALAEHQAGAQSSPARQLGRGLGEVAGGAVQVAQGVGIGTTGTAVGVAGAPETGGASLVLTAAAVTEGAVLVEKGALAVTVGLAVAGEAIVRASAARPPERAAPEPAKAPAPNNGNGGRHGGEAHDAAIDNEVRRLQGDANVTNIRKNQQQVDANGNKVGTNRPDVQYDKDGCHHCVEFDTKPASGARHQDTIQTNDPATNVELRTP